MRRHRFTCPVLNLVVPAERLLGLATRRVRCDDPAAQEALCPVVRDALAVTCLEFPVVYVSGYAAELLDPRHQERFVKKPFGSAQLLTTIAAVVTEA